PLECPICHKKFKYHSKCKQHFTKHTGEKPYICNKCNESFQYSSRLFKHITLEHPQSTPASANSGQELGKPSHYNVGLNWHIVDLKSHKAKLKSKLKLPKLKRPFVCNICIQIFYHHGDFQCHLKTHTKGKLFTCPTCKKSFSCSFTLKRHTNTLHPQNPITID
ncbi:hypothetical protein BJ085DRAFT_20914, partial [Dimargaris cristalligena]